MIFDLLQTRLAVLEPTKLKLLDNSALHAGHATNTSGGAHLELHIASAHFEGLTTIACHRLVYQNVMDLIPYPIHALSIKIIRKC
jgi:BolA protein